MSLFENRPRIIGSEVEMGNPRCLIAMFLMCGCPASAGAQAVAPRNVEIGAGLGAAASWFAGGHAIPGGDLRITVPTSDRRAIEAVVGLTPGVGDATVGFYGVLVKRRFGKRIHSDIEKFFSVGAIGTFARYHEDDYRSPSSSRSTAVASRDRTIITLPFIGLIGGDIQHRVAARLAVRVEGQAIMALVLPVGVRIATGVSVPLGRLPAR